LLSFRILSLSSGFKGLKCSTWAVIISYNYMYSVKNKSTTICVTDNVHSILPFLFFVLNFIIAPFPSSACF
jgi:hypothetical protein